MTALKDQLADLECVIQELSDRVAALTDAADALFDEVQWRNQNARSPTESRPPFRLTSMPVDPTADDWQINRKNRNGTATKVAERTGTNSQRALFQ